MDARRAAKRLQVLTKEPDWRITRTYVALAQDRDEAETKKTQDLQSRALDHYLDDEEWVKQAGPPRIHGFPYFSSHSAPTNSRWKLQW